MIFDDNLVIILLISSFIKTYVVGAHSNRLAHNIGFYEDLTKIIFELSSNTHLISSAELQSKKCTIGSKIEIILELMVIVLITCKNEDPTKK